MSSFQKILDIHIQDIVSIQTKINELKEFQKQWDEIFILGKELMGFAVKITIRGHLTYYTYLYDKYAHLVNDLYSLINGQLIDNKSLINQCLRNLNLLSVEDFYKREKKIEISFGGLEKEEGFDAEKMKDDFRKRDAEYQHKTMKELLTGLFPNISDDFVITANDIKEYKDNLRTWENELRPHRHNHSHRYEYTIKARNKITSDLTLERLDEIFKLYCKKVEDISIVFCQTGHDFNAPYHYESEVRSAIDIIIFGSTAGFIYKNKMTNKNLADNKGNDPGNPKFYTQFRERFFKSDEFKEMLSLDDTV